MAGIIYLARDGGRALVPVGLLAAGAVPGMHMVEGVRAVLDKALPHLEQWVHRV